MTVFHITVSSPLGYILWALQFAATGIGATMMVCGGLYLASHVIDWTVNRAALTLGLITPEKKDA